MAFSGDISRWTFTCCLGDTSNMVTGGSDIDSDGYCDEADCDPFDPNRNTNCSSGGPRFICQLGAGCVRDDNSGIYTTSNCDGQCGNTQCDNSAQVYCESSGGWWNNVNCECYTDTPIVIDILGNGFNLTNASNGVNFDIDPDGTIERIA